MDNVKFSVSMSVYSGDQPEWFKESLDSVLNQTLKPSEIILVVDGPVNQKLNDIINKYELNHQIIVKRLEKNVGHGMARNIGLNLCKYNIVALMDADDISTPNRFEMQVEKLIKNPNISVVGGQIIEFSDSINNIISRRKVKIDDIDIKLDMKYKCPMNLVTVMFKKKDVIDVGGFLDWYHEEDYYLWVRMAKKNLIFSNINDDLVYVRVGTNMYKRRGGLKYFLSEYKFQKYLLNEKIIKYCTYIINVFKRFIVQVILPANIRGWIFKNFGREKL